MAVLGFDFYGGLSSLQNANPLEFGGWGRTPPLAGILVYVVFVVGEVFVVGVVFVAKRFLIYKL
jgi:hypothetical protein